MRVTIHPDILRIVTRRFERRNSNIVDARKYVNDNNLLAGYHAKREHHFGDGINLHIRSRTKCK